MMRFGISLSNCHVCYACCTRSNCLGWSYFISSADRITRSHFHLRDPCPVPRTQKKRKVSTVHLVAKAIDQRVDTRVEHTHKDSKMVQGRVHPSYVIFEQQIIQLVGKPTHSKNDRC